MPDSERQRLAENFLLRVATAVLLLPLVLWLIWLGGTPFYALLIAMSVMMTSEWLHITRAVVPPYAMPVLVLIIVGALGLHMMGLVSGLSALGMAVAIALMLGMVARERIWIFPAGAAYILAPILIAIWLRADGKGILVLLYLLLVVIATDTFAMLTGRWLGRTQLAPKLSPKKTWEGLAGGVIAASLAGSAFAWWLAAPVLPIVVMSAILALCAQAGDLFESALKRRAGLDNSGNLLPGHGGLLDRIDGLIAVLIIAAVLIWLRDGVTHGATDALLAW